MRERNERIQIKFDFNSKTARAKRAEIDLDTISARAKRAEIALESLSAQFEYKSTCSSETSGFKLNWILNLKRSGNLNLNLNINQLARAKRVDLN